MQIIDKIDYLSLNHLDSINKETRDTDGWSSAAEITEHWTELSISESVFLEPLDHVEGLCV